MSVSIWQPVQVDGEPAFARPPPLPFGDHYATREVIPAAKPPGTHRVCFFGESAAAGYLYAPHLTPAQALESLLIAADGPGSWEVVDLSQTNETLAGLVAKVRQARALEPDHLVVFAGNNWNLLETPEVSPFYPDRDARREYAAALRDAGPAGPVELAGRRRLRRAGEALAAIAEHRLPLVLVVPAVNLADWEARQPPPWLPGDGTGEWHRDYAAATAALAAGELTAARESAERMLDLDRGLTPAPFRVLAAAGLPEAAEAEVAAEHYATMCFLGSPRAAPVDQEVQRRAARVHGFALVDLPAIFRDLEPLPGRRLFLDYCHLTAEGIGVAMAAVAAELVGRDVAAAGPGARAAVEATARLGAAIHTAHRLLAVDPRTAVVGHWLRAALAADPGAAEAMLDVAAARAAPVPELLTPAQQRNRTSRHRLGFQHGWRFDHLDAQLLVAIEEVLDGAAAPLLARRAVGDEPVELVPESLWEPAARPHPEVVEFADVTVAGFLRSAWPAVALAFVAGASADHEVAVTARIPSYGRPGTAAMSVNGRPAGTLPVGHRWATGTVRLPAAGIRSGVNRLELAWPELPPVGSRQLDAAIERLERGLPADLHPQFGELWSVQVRRVARP